MQEDQIAVPFLGTKRQVADAGQPRLELGQLMIVGGEQGAAAVHIMQGLGAGPGDGQTVIGRGATANLVQNDQRTSCGLCQDGCGFDHLGHEGRAAPGQIIPGPDAAKEPVHNPDAQARGGHIGSGLSQHRQ